MPNVRVQPSTLSATGANTCLDLINLIGQVKLEEDVYTLWLALQEATNAHSILCVVFEGPNSSSSASAQPKKSDKNISVGVDDAWFEYYNNEQAHEYDPLVLTCILNPGVHDWESVWGMIDETMIPPDKLARHKHMLAQCKMDDGLASVVKSEAMDDFYVLVAIGLPVGEDPESEAIVRNIIPHLASSLERPGVLSAPELSEKELVVLRLITKGHTYKYIAEKTDIKERTVKFHAANIFRLLGVGNKTEAIHKANKIYEFK